MSNAIIAQIGECTVRKRHAVYIARAPLFHVRILGFGHGVFKCRCILDILFPD